MEQTESSDVFPLAVRPNERYGHPLTGDCRFKKQFCHISCSMKTSCEYLLCRHTEETFLICINFGFFS
ncbi:unnamed protein product [Macrosiphum euphorbiae]|uniref:Uncharacterized protein n=1 Tax=Macrosiphum euphorbiae TaxID=13131 RepID=A0AAV0WZ78_9HEMI|nr:unnamed protein product [Macrosiphum euphorbiae]